MRRARATAESRARAERIARALSGQLREPLMPRDSDAPPQAAGGGLVCPCCAGAMETVGTTSGVETDQCLECGAVWLDAGELAALIKHAGPDTSGERPVVTMGEVRTRMARVARPPKADEEVRYRECPRCGAVMARRNFGTISGVVIDECQQHGVLLDEGELQAIEAFVQMGGQRLGEQARGEQSQRAMAPPPEPPHPLSRDVRSTVEGVVAESVADRLFNLLFRW